MKFGGSGGLVRVLTGGDVVPPVGRDQGEFV